MSTIKRVEAYDFAGTLYRNEDDAKHVEALLNLREFLQAELKPTTPEDVEYFNLFLSLLDRKYEKLTSLLNKLY